MKKKLRVIAGWSAELLGVVLIAGAAYRVSVELGMVVAGAGLLAVGYVVYGDRR